MGEEYRQESGVVRAGKGRRDAGSHVVWIVIRVRTFLTRLEDCHDSIQKVSCEIDNMIGSQDLFL